MNVHEYEEALDPKPPEEPVKLDKVTYKIWNCRYCDHDVAHHYYEWDPNLICFTAEIQEAQGIVRCSHYNCTCLHTYETYMKGNEEARRMR